MKDFKALTEYEIVHAAYSFYLTLWGQEWDALFIDPDNTITQARAKVFRAKLDELQELLLDMERSGNNSKIWNELI